MYNKCEMKNVLNASLYNDKMIVFVAPLRVICNWKRKRNRPYILFLMVPSVSFLYFVSGPVLTGRARLERELTMNNIAFVMRLKTSKNGYLFVYRFKHCIASICRHSSIALTLHIFANSMGKRESSRVLESLAPSCSKGLKVKFYDVDEVIENVLPSINTIKVSELHVNDGHTKDTPNSCIGSFKLNVFRLFF